MLYLTLGFNLAILNATLQATGRSMIKIKTSLLILALLSICVSAQALDPLFYTPDEAKKIQVNNRVLAKVNGKAVSVYDIMKKMDMLFYRAYPEYTSSTVARYQFYQANWKRVLQDLIDKELIMADAEENKLQVSNGDIRQEMETIFGPNIIANLDKVGLSFDEAWKMVHSDIVIKRMLYIRTQAKALKQVTPQVVREYYEQFALENQRPDIWTYYVISIREKDPAKGDAASKQAYRLLAEEHVPLEKLMDMINELMLMAPTTKMSISEEFKHTDKDVSTAYKSTLLKMTPGSYSLPIGQKSRADNSTVYRIFYLKAFEAGGAPSFSEVSSHIKQKLIDEIADKETGLYIKRLRKHFDVHELHLDQISSDEFEPFRLA